MKFNKLNVGQYNMMKVNSAIKCSVCNNESNYMDYWNGNNFCSTECQEQYYNWLKKNKDSIA